MPELSEEVVTESVVALDAVPVVTVILGGPELVQMYSVEVQSPGGAE